MADGSQDRNVLGGSIRKKLPSVQLKLLHGADADEDDNPDLLVTVENRLIADELKTDISIELNGGRPLNVLYRWLGAFPNQPVASVQALFSNSLSRTMRTACCYKE